MHPRVVVLESMEGASEVIGQLREAGIEPDGISLAMKVTEGLGRGKKVRRGDEPGTHLSARLGLSIVWTSVVTPGVGTIAIGGPLSAALAGASGVATEGGLVGALMGSGVLAADAAEYARLVEQGGIVVAVDAEGAEARRCERIFETRVAKDPARVEPVPMTKRSAGQAVQVVEKRKRRVTTHRPEV